MRSRYDKPNISSTSIGGSRKDRSSNQSVGSIGIRSSNQRNLSNKQNNQNDDPITAFSSVIAKLPAEEWKAKTVALEHLVNDLSDLLEAKNEGTEEVLLFQGDDTSVSASTICSLDAKSVSSSRLQNVQISSSVSGVMPKPVLHSTSLRNLSYPFRTLLTDLRALVVKAACATLATLSQMLENRLVLLLRDLLPTLLSLHAQTVKVMHGYAQSAVETMLSYTKNSRPIVGILISDMRTNKSKDVRSVCITYIDVILTNWTMTSFFIRTSNGEGKKSNRATKNRYTPKNNRERPLYLIIGRQLMKSIADPSQQVRIQARQTFMSTFRRKFPSQFLDVIHDHDGPLAKEPRLKRSILTQAKQEESLFENIEQLENENIDDIISHQKTISVKPEIPQVSVGIPRSLNSVTKHASRSVESSIQSPKASSHSSKYTLTSPTASASKIFSSPYHTADSEIPVQKLQSHGSTYSGKHSTVKNPFSLAIDSSPKQYNMNRPEKITVNQYPHNSPAEDNSNDRSFSKVQILNDKNVQSRLKYDACSSIQAAVRGMLTRKRIMKILEEQLEEEVNSINNEFKRQNRIQEENEPQYYGYKFQQNGIETSEIDTKDNINDKNGRDSLPSPEMSMLREARLALARHTQESSATSIKLFGSKSPKKGAGRASLLGITAKEMSIRRRTAGKIDVLPLPISPSVQLYENDFQSESDADSPLKMQLDGKKNGNDSNIAEIKNTKQVNNDRLGVPPSTNRESMLFTPHRTLSESSAKSNEISKKRQIMRESSVLLKNRLHHQSSSTLESEPLPIMDETRFQSEYDTQSQCSNELKNIGQDLLVSHKHHIDEIMEILNEEMLIVKKFEDKLRSGRIGDEDIITYFEGISDCLNQRDDVGEVLRSSLKKISQG